MTLDITLYEYGPSRSRQARWTLLECGAKFVSGEEFSHSLGQKQPKQITTLRQTVGIKATSDYA